MLIVHLEDELVDAGKLLESDLSEEILNEPVDHLINGNGKRKSSTPTEEPFELLISKYMMMIRGKIFFDWERMTSKFSKPKTGKTHWHKILDLTSIVEQNSVQYVPLNDMLPFFLSKLCTKREEFQRWQTKLLEERLRIPYDREADRKRETKRKRQEKVNINSLGLQSSCPCKVSQVEASGKRRAIRDIRELHNQGDQVRRVREVMCTFEEMLTTSDQQLKHYIDIYANSEKQWFVERVQNFIEKPRNRLKVEQLLKSQGYELTYKDTNYVHNEKPLEATALE
ncbi:hypothetical protein PROFUN_08326 [Planoprotostelium fungivorum]|uniref:Uncharacterized protein n=1 Tax=Planoprotostelium fungivorum TaxID=1890364 RepID=A0A2P6NI14_9EUKA|nr:hypothetical protein PROFUN_08326 [Planoprotostelium fungivorum]